MSRSAISDRGRWQAGAIAWRLALTFWVGGMWMLHFVLLPMLEQSGMASLLVESVADQLRPVLIGFAAFCGLWQGLILLGVTGLAGWLRDVRGQLLLCVLLLAAAYGASLQWAPQWLFGQYFCFLAQALCGLFLVLQPVPQGGPRQSGD